MPKKKADPARRPPQPEADDPPPTNVHYALLIALEDWANATLGRGNWRQVVVTVIPKGQVASELEIRHPMD